MDEEFSANTNIDSSRFQQESEGSPHSSAEVQQPSAPPQQDAEPMQQSPENPQQPITEFPQMKERAEAHAITVRRAVRMFEDAGVARSPRTIINWCHPNYKGVSRLDCWQDPTDHAYYIAQESIEQVIQEEKAKGKYANVQQPNMYGATTPHGAEPGGQSAVHVQHSAEEEQEEFSNMQQPAAEKDSVIRQLRRKLAEANFTVRGKDALIEELQKDRERFMEKLVTQSELVGGLRFENRQLKALQAPRENPQTHESKEVGEQPTEDYEQKGE